jgi:hypothetical protein
LKLRKNNDTPTIKPIKLKVEPFPDTKLSLADQFTLIDTVMQIPITSNTQIQIYIYKYREIEYLDIRHYRLMQGKFTATKKGVRLPLKSLPQLLIRLSRIDINSKRRKKNKFFLNIEEL